MAALVAALLVLLCILPARAAGQVIDARLIPPGALRISFAPDYQSWNRVFDENGTRQPLGRYLSSSNSADLFPSLLSAQSSVRAISGNATYQISAGAIATTVDADVRHFPLDFSLGLARRLTLNATLPITVTRTRAVIGVDSTTANAGWNQAALESGSATGVTQIASILTQLQRAASDLNGQIASGSYGCPGSVMCAEAQALRGDLQVFRDRLITLSGVTSGGPTPPLAPLAASGEGIAITGRLSALNAELGTFGVAIVPGTFPLPAGRVSSEDIGDILTSTSFGYQATLPAYTKRARIGDVEVGARFGLVQSGPLRMVLTASARLPTGNRDFADHLSDIGTGDRQLDLTGGVEIAAEGRTLSLTAGGWYTLQTAGPFTRRLTPPTQPIALATTTVNVNRDLGEVLILTASPALQLTEGFRVHGLFSYFNKAADHFTDLGATPPGLTPSVLDSLTAMKSLTVGGGLTYTLSGGRNGLPMDAGMNYARTVSGSGGFVPAVTTVSMYLRAYYKLW